MEFFKLLGELDVNNINLAIKKDALNRMTVLVSCPKGISDTELNLLAPLYLTGTAEELDTHFFNKIASPLEQTQVLITNAENYQKQILDAKQSTAEEKDKQKKIIGYKEKIKAVQEDANYDVLKDSAKVFELIEKILVIEPKNTFAVKLKEEIINKTTNVGLFESTEEEQ